MLEDFDFLIEKILIGQMSVHKGKDRNKVCDSNNFF